MNEMIQFGIPVPDFRTGYGTLRTRELEKIVSFINKKGILIADCFDRKIVIVHPYLTKDIQDEMINAGFRTILIGSTVLNLRKHENLNLAQNRVLEALTPGALIVRRSDDESNLTSVAVPDNFDLRDICCLFEGTIQGFITDTGLDKNELGELLSKMRLDGINLNKIGILEYPYFDEEPANMVATVAYIYGPNNIKIVKEGVYDLDTLEQASAQLSQYEIGEWS